MLSLKTVFKCQTITTVFTVVRPFPRLLNSGQTVRLLRGEEEAGRTMGPAFSKIANSVFNASEEGDSLKNPIYTEFATYTTDLKITQPEEVTTDTAYDPNTDPTIRLQRPRLKLFSEELNKTISYGERNIRDWEWFLFENGWNPFYEHPEEKKRPSFVYCLVEFFIADYYDYVPFFQRSARYYLWQPIQDCPAEKMYCTFNTFDERQELIPKAFMYFGVTVLIFFAMENLIGIPLFTSLVPYLVFIFLRSPTCIPCTGTRINVYRHCQIAFWTICMSSFTTN